MMRAPIWVTAVLFVLTGAVAPGKEEIWEGKLTVNADQGAKGLKVDSVALEEGTLKFALKAAAAEFSGKLNEERAEAVGEWKQGGVALPLALKKMNRASELRRPQTPKPPYPYNEETVSYKNLAGGVSLTGTLTTPKGTGPFPAVLLISGSGAQDRDETIFEHKPFLVLADHLTRRGVAVLRVADRGGGGSSGKTAGE
jgi:hypothetical protein